MPHACRWVVRLAVLESRPFSELRRLLKGFKDDRLAVFGEWVRRAQFLHCNRRSRCQ